MLSLNSHIYIAGHRGMVGSAIVRNLRENGYHNLITLGREELDLTNQAEVRDFFRGEKIDCVVVAAAKVGGIQANNSTPAEFIYDNLMIECNLIHNAHLSGIRDLLFLGSSCIYPRLAPQPIREEFLLDGHLEPTNEAYAVAKIAGIKLCESYNRQYGTRYRSLMPTNLYGPNDNFDLENSHVIPALLRKFHEAKIAEMSFVPIWGSGTPRREFLHVDDLAEACRHILQLDEKVMASVTSPMSSHLNVGSGEDLSIRELTILIGKIVGFRGDLHFDSSKPDGTPRKLLDVGRMGELGWRAEISLEQGLRDTYRWYCQQLLEQTI